MNFIAPHQKPTVTSAIGQKVKSKLGRGTISAVISAAVLAVAGVILYKLLQDADFGKVLATLKAQSPEKITIAAVFVVAGYITLTFYDYFALHAIDRGKVPYTIAALASFTSFTIGHSLGAAVLTGGLIRFRIYSAWGLTVLDIAKIAFITSITFWLGNAFLSGRRRRLCAGSCRRSRPPAAMGQPLDRLGRAVRDPLLSVVAGAAPPFDRPRRLAHHAADVSIHAGADCHRRARPDADFAGHVCGAAAGTAGRLHHHDDPVP